MMKIILFSLSLILITLSGISQSNDSIRKQANFYYDNDEFEMALLKYNLFLNQGSKDFESFKKRGNCHFNLGDNEKAINDYLQALLIKPDYTDVLFNLGNIYDNMGKTDSAVYFFRKYSFLKPHEAIAFVRLSLLKLNDPLANDSALFYAQRAVETEPENYMCYYALSMAFLYDERYSESVKVALKGLNFGHPESAILYHPLGISYYFLKNYDNAYTVFTKADSLELISLNFIDYRVQSLLMKNTSKEIYTFKTSGKIIFKDFIAANMPDLDKWSKSKDQRYSYSFLLSKFHSSLKQMGIDEFFMLYYGYTNDAAYSPCGDKTSDLMDLWNNKDYEKFSIEAEQFLAKDPTHLGLYWNLSVVYGMNGNKKQQFENLYKYYGFLEGIVASGTGTSPDSAYIVIKISDEYEVLNNFGYLLKRQSLINKDQSSYDLMVCEDPFGEEKQIYFNIDKALKTMDFGRKSKRNTKNTGK